jgi:RNA polymerase sigma-70 factor (ECF subfamily)
MVPETSVTLLERLRRHEADAWERFVRLYTPLLFHWARQGGLQDREAEELVEDVFAALLRDLPRFHQDPGQRFHVWLWTLFQGLLRGRLQTVAPHSRSNHPTVVDSPRQLEPADRAVLLRQALRLLENDLEPLTWRAAWEMLVEGRSAHVVGQSLGWPAQAVQAARLRVLGRLRRELRELLD